MESYRSGDVAERTRWVMKRGIRSGSGRNFASESEQKISGTATGHNEAEPRKIEYRILSFLSFNIYGGISKRGRCRALPVADKARHKEWQRSKFFERERAENFGHRNRT